MDRSGSGSSNLIGTSSLLQTPQKLQSRVKQLQRELSQYREQILKKDEQIQYLNTKNTQLIQTKTNGSSKRISDHIYQSSLQQQLDKVNLKLNDKNKQYERLYHKYTALENDMATLEDFATDLDRERKFLADKLANIQIHTEVDEVVGELQNKLALMSTQILRVGQLARRKSQENNELRFKLKSKQQQVQDLENQLSEKEKVLYQFRQKLRNLQRQQLQFESNRDFENESTYKILSLQIERLNVQINNKLEQIGTLEHRNRMLEERLSLQNSNVGNANYYKELEIEVQKLNKINIGNKSEIEELEVEVKKISRQNKDISDENEKYRRAIRKLQQQLEQTRNSYIKNQNEKIRIEVQTSEKTIREQNTIIQKLQRQSQMQSEQREQMMRASFEQQVYQLKNLLQQSQYKCSSLKNDLMKYQEKLVMLSQEVQRLSLQNNKFQEENAQLKRLQYKIQTKQREIRQAERVRESVNVQSRRDKAEVQRLKIQIQGLWQKNRQLQSKQYKLASVSDELEMVTERLNNRERQYRILEQKVQESESLRTSGYRLKELEGQLQSERRSFYMRQEELTNQYRDEINNLRDNVYKLQARCRQLSSQQSSSQSNYAILADEIRRLNEVLSDSSQTIIAQKREISLLESNLQIAQQSLQKVKQSRYANQEMEAELKKRTEVYRKQISLYQTEMNQTKLKLQEQISNVRMVQQQLFHIKQQLEETRHLLKNKQNENMYLMDDIRTNKRNQESLLTLVKQIKQSNYRLQAKLAAIQQDYIRKLQDKSNEKQILEKEYVEYNRKIRQYENENTTLSFQVQSLRNKIQMQQSAERSLQQENVRLRNKLEEQMRDKSANIRMTIEEYKSKISDYEQQMLRNAKKMGQIQASNQSLNNQVYKMQSTIRQLQEEKYQIQNQNRELESDRRRQIQAKSFEARTLLQRRQMQMSGLRQEISTLQEQLRTNSRTIQQKSKLIIEYENKLAMLSQQLQRVNDVILNRNKEIQSMNEKLALSQQSINKQSKETLQIFTIQITRLNTALCQSLEHTKELEQEIENKEKQNRRMLEIGKRNEEGYKHKLAEMQRQIQNWVQQNHKNNANIGVLNKKIQSLQRAQKDNEILKHEITSSNSQKNKYKNTITDLQSQISTLKNNYENTLQNEKHTLTSKASIKMTQLQQNKRQLQRNITRLVNQNQQLVAQVQNLRREIQRSDEEYTATKKELIRVQNQAVNLARQKEKYKMINQEVMAKVEKMTTNRMSEHVSKQAYEFQVKHLEGVIKQYENQMMVMKQQMERASNRQRSRDNSSVGSSTARRSSNNNSVGQGSQLQQKYNILESLHLKLKREADGLRQKITQYEFKMKKLKGQFDLINKLTHEYKQQNDYLRNQNHSQCVYVGKTLQNQAVSSPSSTQIVDKNEQLLVKQTLATEIDRLTIINTTLKREMEELRLQSVDMQSVRNRYEEMNTLFVIMAVEIEALRLNKNI